ncbi:MAG: transporter substrate-binding domain-containing protein [Alphaproteobacteria bacterium]|nr:transporter substrate-binding domain-containing protein [Alphaproteobacteria bacterium]
MRIRVAALAFLAAILTQPAFAGPSPTLQKVLKNGYLRCGVSEGLQGFSTPDAKGRWTGLDVDFCRALAAAIFGDAQKVRFTPASAKVRFTALQSGEYDVLSRNTTWTMSRDVQLGLEFAGTIYYDGQGFMVPKKLNIKSAKQLNGANICTNTGTTTELNLADYFRSNKLKYTVIAFEREPEVVAAYDSGRCDAITTDQSGLYAERLTLKNPADHVILPEIISKEPLGPAVNQSDPQWGDIVRWTLFALINAEELGVTSKNVDQMLKSPNPEIRRLLGVEGSFGQSMGLSNDWAVRAIKQVGNYGEIFERNVGQGSPLKIQRGLNALWKHGGLQYAPPVR